MSEPARFRVPLGPFLALFYAFFSLVLAGIFLSLVSGFGPGGARDIPSAGLAIFAASVLVATLIDRVHGGRDALALRVPNVAAIPLALVGGFALAPLSDAVADLVVKRFPHAGDGDALDLGATLGSKGLSAAAFLILLPFAEELLFRGALLGALRDRPALTLGGGDDDGGPARPTADRAPPVPGAAFVALGIFALTRGEPRTIPSALLLGASTTFLRLRTETVVAAMLFHVGYMLRDVVGIFVPAVAAFPTARLVVLAPCAVVWLGCLALVAKVGAAPVASRSSAAVGD
jgi:hypothetical protein